MKPNYILHISQRQLDRILQEEREAHAKSLVDDIKFLHALIAILQETIRAKEGY